MATKLAEQAGTECISWDNSNLGCERNHLQAWEYLRSSPEPFVCILEDDAVLCADFRHQLNQVLAAAPTPLVGLYLGRGRPDQWQLPISSVIAQEACFIRSPVMLNGVAYAVRTELLAHMLRSVSRTLTRTHMELPEAVTRWTSQSSHLTGVMPRPFSYCRPSIVQHRDVTPVIQVWDRPDGQERTEQRTAWMFAPRLSWESTYVDLPRPDLRRTDRVERHLALVRSGEAYRKLGVQ